MQHIELADKLGIKKQNINMWIKGKQNIPKKYLPILEELFGIKVDYFSKDIDEIDKLEIQKEKLKRDLKPIIKNEQSVYAGQDINRFKNSLEIVDPNPYIDTYKLVVEVLEKGQHESIVHKTIEALAHYLEVLPEGITTGEEQAEFESEIFEVFDDNNF